MAEFGQISFRIETFSFPQFSADVWQFTFAANRRRQTSGDRQNIAAEAEERRDNGIDLFIESESVGWIENLFLRSN